VRQLRAARRARASSILRGRKTQRAHRYHVARARRVRAVATVRRVCAASA
jgi:hypothetical protein